MSTDEQRRLMASIIVDFEARRDAQGHLAVYKLTPGDGGGKYEVAGINDRYNKEVVDVLVKLIEQKRFDEAEALAVDFIAQDTDRAQSWTSIPAIEFYLRDSVFNRGGKGGARILQRALAVPDDGVVGPKTRAAVKAAEADPIGLLGRLRQAREQYERDVAGRDEKSKFWKGLVNRWNNALTKAKTFPMQPASPAAKPALESTSFAAAAAPLVEAAAETAILPALRIGMMGPRVFAWQTFLVGQGFTLGEADGAFGERTREATRAFQTAQGLPADGVAGRQTLLKAAELGFEIVEEPADDNTGSNFPPHPDFGPLTSNAQRAALFGKFEYVPAPVPGNKEAIRILGTWESDNIVKVAIPQLKKALGANAPSSMRFHKLAEKQLQGVWSDWENSGLLDRVLTYEGAFNARFVRGSHKTLSNHAFGSAFDINYAWNKLNARPALVGEKGSVRELVQIANSWGFYWGGHYTKRKDGMHFEIAFLK